MDVFTIISQTSPPASSGTALDVGVLATIVGASITSALLALILARALRLHRTHAARRSAGHAGPVLAASSHHAVLIEPKPYQHQRAA